MTDKTVSAWEAADSLSMMATLAITFLSLAEENPAAAEALKGCLARDAQARPEARKPRPPRLPKKGG